MALDPWWSHGALPHLLNTLVQVLKEGEAGMEGKKVSQDQLEELLPHLCLSLPSYTLPCADLLRSMPDGSIVWGRLEEALKNKKLLHHEITCVIYLRHQAALEREVMRVLALYVGAECHKHWWRDERLGISHFKPHGSLLRANPPCTGAHKKATLKGDVHKVNKWSDSPLMEASGHSTQLFTRCLELLGNVLLKTRFSFSAVTASRDYLAQQDTSGPQIRRRNASANQMP